MKIKKLISTIACVTAVAAGSITVCAQTHTAKPLLPQLDEVCGHLKISGHTDDDIYVKIVKHTPESETDPSTNENLGYTVYDTIIKADKMHAGDSMEFGLEYNNYNGEGESYDGCYDIYIGMHSVKNSQDMDDVLYNKLNLLVCDVNYCGYDTNCTVNISVTEEELKKPVCKASGALPDITYNMVFPVIKKQEPATEPPAEPPVLYGDANGDGVINIRDAAFIGTMLAQGKKDNLTESADFNQDGSVNIRDAAAIAIVLANGNK